MDFEYAAKRLEREQSKLKSRHGKAQHISAKAKREVDYRKRQQQQMKEKRDREQAQRAYMQKVFAQSEVSLRVRALGKRGENLNLMATSIHGDGDKIALPPSVLERLTSQAMDGSSTASSPWTFRVGILNPDYVFPASLAMKNLKPPVDDDDIMDDDNDDEKEQSEYLEELSHKYIAYSHATVVEFTQEEGHVGLPSPIAFALLDEKRRRAGVPPVKMMRTQDPAAAKLDTDDDASSDNVMDEDEEKTPGHLAWGAFDVPNAPLEISLVTLPKGRGCTLVPTMDAIRAGFHQLKDVKLVLEQSLIRTRATLSIDDAVATWHRGVKYDLTVASVTPPDWRAISCINTDIEVDIGPNEDFQRLAEAANANNNPNNSRGQTLGGKEEISSESAVPNAGQTLGGVQSPSAESTTAPIVKTAIADLIPEPAADQSQDICTVQIRADKGTGRRRFDVNVATVKDLFAFASSLTDLESFHLVTRFPRRVVSLEGSPSLSAAGIQAGQELFMVEKA